MNQQAPVPRVVMDVPAAKVRLLARIVACLAKINDEFYIEPMAEQVVLRVVNSLRTVHLAVTLQASFFSELSVDTTGMQANPDEEFNIRVAAKYFGAIFKNPNLLSSLRLELTPGCDTLRVAANTVYDGITKTWRLSYVQELSDKAQTEPMTAVRLRTRPAQLSEALSNFHQKCEHIRFSPAEQRLLLSSDAASASAYGDTSISLSVNELVAYEYEVGVLEAGPKTFEQKHLRALLALTDACGLEMNVSFDRDRAPLLLEAEGGDLHPVHRTTQFQLAMLVSAWECDVPADPTPRPPPAAPQTPQQQMSHAGGAHSAIHTYGTTGPHGHAPHAMHAMVQPQPQVPPPAMPPAAVGYGTPGMQAQAHAPQSSAGGVGQAVPAPSPQGGLATPSPLHALPASAGRYAPPQHPVHPAAGMPVAQVLDMSQGRAAPQGEQGLLAGATPVGKARTAWDADLDPPGSAKRSRQDSQLSQLGDTPHQAAPPAPQQAGVPLQPLYGSSGNSPMEPSLKYAVDGSFDEAGALEDLGSWRPDKYYSQVEVSQFPTQQGAGRAYPYAVLGAEEDVLEGSVSPQRYE